MATLTTIPTLTGNLDVEHDGTLSPVALFDAHHSMPALAGSEKQVEWGMQIRRDSTANMATMIAEDYETEGEDGRIVLESAMRAIKGQTSAKWWIDNRHHAKGINGHVLDDILMAELAKVPA